jgi:hypothetical protein
MHENVPVRFGRGRLDSLGNKGLAAYFIAGHFGLGAHVDGTDAGSGRVLGRAIQPPAMNRLGAGK